MPSLVTQKPLVAFSKGHGNPLIKGGANAPPLNASTQKAKDLLADIYF
jgi:hypothetical protein